MITMRMHALGVVELSGAMARAGALWPKVAEQIATETVEIMQATAMGVVKDEDALFRRTLLNGFTTQVISEGTGADFRVRGILSNEVAHAAVVDQGRRPGSRPPPTDAILPWVIQKIGDFSRFVRVSGQAKSAKGKRADQNASKASQARGVAYVIARSIGRKGTRGIFFMRQAAETGAIQVSRVADRVLADFVGKF